METRDSARMGKAVEHLVAATCILASDFELNVSTSLVDDEGVDLVFHRRDDSTTLAVQVKSRSMAARSIADKRRFIANVGANTFDPRNGLYMLFVAVDTQEGTIDTVWLVPSKDFDAKTTASGRKRHRFSASMKDGTQDQWSSYRCSGAELVGQVREALDRLAESARE